MRKITSFAIGAVALAGVAAAEVEASAYAGLHSHYIYRGSDLGNDTSFADFGLDFAGSCDCGVDWYAGAWYAATDTTDEFDIFFGASKDLGIGTVDLGYIHYAYPGAEGSSDSEVYLGLSTGYAGFELGLTTSVGIGGASQNTTWIEGSAGYGLEVSGYALALEFVAGYQAGANGIDKLGYYGANLSTDIAVSDDITLSPYISYIQSHDDLNDGDGGFNGFYGGASVSFAF